MKDLPDNDSFETGRWNSLFREGIECYLVNLRDVYRFLSALKFYSLIWEKHSELEINIVDFIAIHTLQLFEAKCYSLIYDHKVPLTGAISPKNETAFYDQLQKIDHTNKNACNNIVELLFPNLGAEFGSVTYSHSDWNDEWNKSQRLCHQNHFEKYYSNMIPEGIFSRSELKVLISKTNAPSSLEKALLQLDKKELLSSALHEMRPHINDFSSERQHNLALALLHIGDIVEDNDNFFNKASVSIWGTFEVILKNVPKDQRGSYAEKLFLESNRCLSVFEVVLFYETKNRKHPEKETIFLDESYEKLKKSFLNTLENTAFDNPLHLLNHVKCGSLLWRWKQWGTEATLTQWCKDQFSRSTSCIQLLGQLSRTVHQTQEGVTTKFMEIDKKALRVSFSQKQ